MVNPDLNVFCYDNFRAFLKDFMAGAKAKDKKYSLRYFSMLLGFTSPIYVKRVIDGKRNLSSQGIEKFIRVLKLGKNEAKFFRNLVCLNQSKTLEEKKLYAERIIRIRAANRIFPLREAQFKYFAQWYLVPIRELVGLPDFQEDPEWISKALVPPITPSQAKRGLEELTKLGLLSRDRSGKLIQSEANVISPDEIISAFKADCLLELIKLAGESIKRVPRERRDISSVTFPLSRESFDKIKEMIIRFREELLEVAQRSGVSDNVYHLNLQLFPLTDIPTEEKG